MVQYKNFDRVMEAEDHFKNGASSKSQMSRKNFRISQMFSNLCKIVSMIAITAMCIKGSANAQTEPNITSEIIAIKKEKNGVIIVTTKRNQSGNVGTPLFVVDGKETNNIESLLPKSIETISFLKDISAIEPYDIKAKNGVVIVTTKRNQSAPLFVVDWKKNVGNFGYFSPLRIEGTTFFKGQSFIEQYTRRQKMEWLLPPRKIDNVIKKDDE